jgi:hypothetical protein
MFNRMFSEGVLICESCNSNKINLAFHSRWSGSFDNEDFEEIIASYLCTNCGYFSQSVIPKTNTMKR